jgi:S1-C subfamily serine protease
LKRALPFLTALLSLPTAALAIEPAHMERLAASIFRIEARDAYGRLNSGSGVMIAPRTVVTNCHVVLNTQEIKIAGVSGHWAGQVMRANTERDLCLLDVPALEGAIAILGDTTDKRAGEPIAAVGYPPGAVLTWSHGLIEGLHTHNGTGRVVQGSAFFNPGKSGGGLFDFDGRLIGILTFKLRAGGPYHFAVPAEWVASLLHDVSGTALPLHVKHFWQHTGEQQPVFVRAASLSAEGDCVALNALTSQRLAREPGNPEAVFMAERAQRCDAGQPAKHPLFGKLLAALRY